MTRSALLLLLSAALPAFGQPLAAAGQPGDVLLDRGDDVAAWSVNPGPEFPGATGRLSLAGAAAGGPGLRLDYDFTGGGNYVTLARGLDLAAAAEISFWVRQEGNCPGFIRLADATGQEHAGSYAAVFGEWTKVVIPLDASHFGQHWQGANDGHFHFPLRRLLIGVNRGGGATGSLFVRDLETRATPVGAALAAQARDALLDRGDDLDTWSVDPGAEFPGAVGALGLAPTAGGRQCLRLQYDFTGGGNYVTAARALDLGATSEITFWVRQEGNTPGFIRLQDDTEQEHAGGFTAATGEWSKVVIPLDAKHFPGHWHGDDDGQFRFPLKRLIIGVSHGGGPKGALFIRDLSARTVDTRQFLHVALRTPYPGNIAFTGAGDVPVTVDLANALDETAHFTLRLHTEDWYGRRLDLPARALTLDPHGRAAQTLSLDGSRPDFWNVSAELTPDGQPAVTTAGAVVVTPQPPDFGYDDPHGFFAIQATSDGARTERLGVKWVRVGHGAPLQAIRAHHQLAMLLVHHDFAPGKRPPAADIEQWAKETVEPIVVRDAPFVDTFEIQNEPDLTCLYQPGFDFQTGVGLYLDVLRAGAAAVRRAAPGARVAGIDVSGGDYDGTLQFSKAVFAGGGGSCIDVYTGHPYAGVRYFGEGQRPMWPVFNQERRKELDTLALIRANGGKQHFWVGEKGWGLHVDADPLSSYSRDFARCLAQSMVIAHSVPGVERYFWFIEEGCNEGGYEYGLFRREQPLPAALAYATAARLLHGAAPVRSIERADALQAHAFTTPGGDGTLVLWAEGDPARLTVAAMPVSWTATDFLGGPLSGGAKGGAMSLNLTHSPIYLRFPAAAVEAVCGAVERGELTCSQPVKLLAAYVADTTHLAARLQNVTNRPVKARVSAAGSAQEVTVPASDKLTVLLPAPPDLLSAGRRDLPVTLTAGGATLSGSARVDLRRCGRPPALADGLLPAAGDHPDFVLDQRGQVLPADPGVGWRGPEDLSVRAWVAWDTQALYFSARVHDPIHHVEGTEAGNFWNSDSLQIAIDPRHDAAPGQGFGPDDVELGMVLAPDGLRVFQTAPASRRLDLRCAGAREGNDTVYRLAMPWKLLGLKPQTGAVLGFNFIINNNNGHGRAYWMGPTPGIGEAKSPDVYGGLWLAGER
jgi:hypothetical protein